MCVTWPPDSKEIPITRFQSRVLSLLSPRLCLIRIKVLLLDVFTHKEIRIVHPLVYLPPRSAGPSQPAMCGHVGSTGSCSKPSSESATALATSRSINYSHQNCRGLVPRLRSPATQKEKIGRLSMKAMIVCLLTAIYSAMVRIPTSSNTSSDNGYVHLSLGILRRLLIRAIWYAARI